MKVVKSGSQPSAVGTSDNFVGVVRRDPLLIADQPSRVTTGLVTFEPGARTHWHQHPLGQTLVITMGCGWVQSEGEEKHVVNAGDVVWIPPHERHWHGATATTAMSHIAITEAVDGSAVDWLEPVEDADFLSV